MIDDRSVADRLRSVLQQQPSAEASQNAPTLYAQVYSAVREALLSGLLAPGELLSLRVVAAALGISPMPVREALGRLMIEGALECIAQSSFSGPICHGEAIPRTPADAGSARDACLRTRFRPSRRT